MHESLVPALYVRPVWVRSARALFVACVVGAAAFGDVPQRVPILFGPGAFDLELFPYAQPQHPQALCGKSEILTAGGPRQKMVWQVPAAL